MPVVIERGTDCVDLASYHRLRYCWSEHEAHEAVLHHLNRHQSLELKVVVHRRLSLHPRSPGLAVVVHHHRCQR